MPLIKAHKGKVAVMVKHLGSGETFCHHADDVMPTASLIKFPVMVEAYRQAAAKKIDLDRVVTLKKEDKVPGSGVLTYHLTEGATFKLRDAIQLMIVFSDNTATNLVLDAIGLGATAATMEKLGYPNTKIHSKVFRRDTSVFPERSKQFGLGSTTAVRDDQAVRSALSQATCESARLRADARSPSCLRRQGQVPSAAPAWNQNRLQDGKPRRYPHRGRNHRMARRTGRALRALL